MPIRDPRVGNHYLTPSGLPVKVVTLGQEHMALQSLASDNLMRVSSSYPLEQLQPQRAAATLRPDPYHPRGPRPRREARAPKSLAPLIDAMLLAGNMTMRGILRELRRKASAACRGRDLEANIRARIFWFRRKGRSAHRDERGRLRVV